MPTLTLKLLVHLAVIVLLVRQRLSHAKLGFIVPLLRLKQLAQPTTTASPASPLPLLAPCALLETTPAVFAPLRRTPYVLHARQESTTPLRPTRSPVRLVEFVLLASTSLQHVV